MKAIRVHEVGGPEVMKLEDVADPVAGPGQVVIKIHAAGVNPVDTYLRSGTQGRTPVLPYTPGSDGAGVVENIGPDVSGVSVGDRVYFGGTGAGGYAGSYAEKTVCQLAQVHPLPSGLSFSQGAAIGVPYVTAYRALFDRAGARPGETVLVHGGSGGVGIAAIQFARAHGLTVLATASSEPGLALASSQGAQHVFNHSARGYRDGIMATTGGRGIDVVIEMLANVNLDHDLGMLALRGRVVVVGNRGRVEIDARQTMSRDATVLGMMLANATPADVARIHSAITAGLSNSTLKPVVGRDFPLAAAPAAHELVMKSGALGKLVLIP